MKKTDLPFSFFIDTAVFFPSMCLSCLFDDYYLYLIKTCVYFIRCIDSYNMKKVNTEQQKKRKAEERKAKAKAGAGKKPGINVQG